MPPKPKRESKTKGKKIPQWTSEEEDFLLKCLQKEEKSRPSPAALKSVLYLKYKIKYSSRVISKGGLYNKAVALKVSGHSSKTGVTIGENFYKKISIKIIFFFDR